MWPQRDVSLFGRVLLTEAEGLLRLIYLALSLFVEDSMSMGINKLLIWDVLTGPGDEAGIQMLDFQNFNYTFKVKWLQECIKTPQSLWYFIPNNVLKNWGGFQLLMNCNYSSSYLPVQWSHFSRQALNAWKVAKGTTFLYHKCIHCN